MTGQLNGGNAEIVIGDGKTMTVFDIKNPSAPTEMPKFTYVKSLSGTKAEYTQEGLTPNAVIEISGTEAKIQWSHFNTADEKITLTLVE